MNNRPVGKLLANSEYAAVQGIYWILSAVTYFFAALFLQGRGYSNSELGLILCFGNLISFFAGPLLGAATDKYEKLTELKLLWIFSILLAVLMAGIYFSGKKGFVLTVSWTLLAALAGVYIPFVTQLCFRMGRWGKYVSFGIGRGIGSLFFALSSAVLGVLVTKHGINVLPITGFILAALFFLVLGVITVQDRRLGAKSEQRSAEAAQESVSLLQFFKNNLRFTLCMLGISLLFFAHNVVCNFDINLVRNVGGDSSDLGRIVAFMGLTELPAMLLFDRLLKRFRCSDLLKFAIIMFPVKSLAMTLANSIPTLYLAHAIQCVSFALIMPAIVRYAGLAVSRRDTGKAQTVAMAATSLGATLASVFGGIMYDHLSVFATLIISFVFAALGCVLALCMTDKVGS